MTRAGHIVLSIALASGMQPVAAGGVPVPPNTAQCLTADEAALIQLINVYRIQNGRAAVPTSFSLAAVGQWHVWDLASNAPVVGQCNLHSWSNAMPSRWTAVCYTPDHAQAQQMWIKPSQVTQGAYNASGYEIAFGASGFQVTPQAALNGWTSSSAHNAVILNLGIWESRNPWPAIGVGMFGGYAVAWFGDATDAVGAMPACQAGSVIFAHGFENPA